MRVLGVLGLALAALGCADDPEPLPPSPPVAAPPVPTHGGSLVALDAFQVELRAHRSGEVYAYLGRLDGQPVASPESGLLTVTLTIDDDHPRPVLLRWNATERRYEARLRREPLEGPADVQLMIAGNMERGSIDRLPIGEALTESGVAYAEAEDVDADDEEEVDDEAADEEPSGSSGRSGGGGIRARARRLFGL
ncbi:MAG: hypothetical protein JJ863_37460 [Deltaproteobacteria bacterium]|nr:hypothetical protein [Deltaproteobacteria bacterium]